MLRWEGFLLVMVEQEFQLEEEEGRLGLERNRRRGGKVRGVRKECAL
jgi:hypothetical protein